MLGKEEKYLYKTRNKNRQGQTLKRIQPVWELHWKYMSPVSAVAEKEKWTNLSVRKYP